MADLKISALTASTTPLAGTEVLPIVQSGTTKQVSVANLTVGRDTTVKNLIATGALTVGTSGTYGVGTVYADASWGMLFTSATSAPTQANFAWLTYAGAEIARMVGTDFRLASGTLTVAGSTQTDGLVSHAGTGGAFGSNKFNFQWTGNPILWVDGTNVGQIATVSDYRIKRNIASQTESGLAKVMQLRPVVYQLANYNNLFVASDDIKEGFIAHELQEVIPSAVSGQKDAEDQIQSLKLDAVCAVLAKAIQEQQAQIEALKADVAALKGA